MPFAAPAPFLAAPAAPGARQILKARTGIPLAEADPPVVSNFVGERRGRGELSLEGAVPGGAGGRSSASSRDPPARPAAAAALGVLPPGVTWELSGSRCQTAGLGERAGRAVCHAPLALLSSLSCISKRALCASDLPLRLLLLFFFCTSGVFCRHALSLHKIEQ